MRDISVIYILALLFIGGCSAKQGYMALHDWQRQQCKNVIDSLERELCFAKAGRTYEEYINSEEYRKSTAGETD